MFPENVTRFVRHSRYEQKSQQLSNKMFVLTTFILFIISALTAVY